MGEFRRFILSVIGTLEILFVVASTLIGGMLGWAIPALFFGERAGTVGLLIGTIAGFCLSGIIVNISMSLSEIAQNTRRAPDLSEQALDETPSARDFDPENPDLTDEEKEEARRLLDKLESTGFRLRPDR